MCLNEIEVSTQAKICLIPLGTCVYILERRNNTFHTGPTESA